MLLGGDLWGGRDWILGVVPEVLYRILGKIRSNLGPDLDLLRAPLQGFAVNYGIWGDDISSLGVSR